MATDSLTHFLDRATISRDIQCLVKWRKHIIEAHKGTISVESNIGKGKSFDDSSSSLAQCG